MFNYSKTSQKNLDTCDLLLIDLFEEVIKYVDCTISCGHRNEKDQNEAFKKKLSQLQWPNSKHNFEPSQAVDVYPYDGYRMVNGDLIDDMYKIYHFAGIVKGIACSEGISVVWGGDWPTFKDFPHWEINYV